VTQRGNGGRQVFEGESDYRLYLELLRRYSKRHDLSLWAYCLMPNHVHLIAGPKRALSLARALGRAHSDPARHVNLQHLSSGHVWEARFFSCPLDGAHLWRAMAYVERNPARAGLAEEAAAYRWSSAAVHLNGGEEDLLDLAAWEKDYTKDRWREVLTTGVDEEALGERLREASVRGRPLGDAAFVEELEQKMRRRLRPLPAGRPRKRKIGGPDQAAAQQLTLEIGV
jgi:putative transposase